MNRERDIASFQTLKVKPFNPSYPFTIPAKGTPSAAGYDLSYVGHPVILAPMQRMALGTNVVMEIPEGYYGRIAPRSGLAFKEGIDVLAGVVDSDYRGEIKVILINLGDKPVSFSEGQKIAQIIIENHNSPKIELVDELTETIRAEGGFGSTDKTS